MTVIIETDHVFILSVVLFIHWYRNRTVEAKLVADNKADNSTNGPDQILISFMFNNCGR